LPAHACDDTSNRDAADDAAPEWSGRDVRRQDGQLPPAGKACEQVTGDARTAAAAAVGAQHEELGHLPRGNAADGPQLANEGEARGQAGHTHDEMMAIVALPESTMPARRRVGAVRVDAPTPADQVIEVQLNQTPDDRNVPRDRPLVSR